MFRQQLTIALLLVVTSAAGDACDPARTAGFELGQAGQPPAAEKYPAPQDCARPFTESRRIGLADYCRPQAGFERALTGQQEQTRPCQDRAFRIDFELGRNLRRLRQEQVELQARRASASAPDSRDVRQQRRRQQVIDRELNQLEGLARIRGLLPPRSGPDDRPQMQ